jgi:hypothetical protein
MAGSEKIQGYSDPVAGIAVELMIETTFGAADGAPPP